MRRSAIVSMLALTAGCAAPAGPPPAAADSAPGEAARASDAQSEGWTSSRQPPRPLYDDSGRPLVSSTVTFDDAPTEDRFATKSIGTPSPSARPRPRRVGKRDIALRGARLDNALRMLARVGNFNLVVQGEIATPVTVDLKGVEPYDAAIVIVEANQLSMSYERGIAVVRRPTKP